jgi:exopolysaccharide biosynthesis polyprenyl glycosylphosphotransferase
MLVLPVDALILLTPVLWAPHYAKAFVAMSLLGVVLLSGGGRYRARLHLSVLDDLPTVLARLLVAAALVAGVFALRHDGQGLEDFMITALICVGLVVAGRVVTTAFILLARRRRVVAHPAILVGGGPLGAEVAELLDRHPRYGLALVGFVDDGRRPDAALVTSHLGAVGDLEDLVEAHGVEVLLVTDGDVDETELLEVVRRRGCAQTDLLVVPRMHAFHTQTGIADHIGSIPVMRIRTPALEGPAWAAKRVFDVVVSLLALIVMAPVMLACAVAVRVDGGPGIIFRQKRVGQDGQLFDCLKFRSMRPATEAESATQWSIADDARVGPVGRVLRRTSLDELPQLWNIVRGDMTLVGPRPERPHFVEKFSSEHPRYYHRHRVRAGLTGLAQVSGLRGADTPISDRARFDNYYIENWSLWLDAKIMLRTVSSMVRGDGR